MVRWILIARLMQRVAWMKFPAEANVFFVLSHVFCLWFAVKHLKSEQVIGNFVVDETNYLDRKSVV